MLERRLKLGTFLGIGLYVHWTFALLIMYIGYVARNEGLLGIFYSVAQLLGVFLCVTLHEYGHALAARQFGVPTLDITLLPIGGVARLQRMPRVPWQELVVAVAGPAVNVVIALGLAILLLATFGIDFFWAVSAPSDEQSLATAETMLTLPTLTGFMFSMMIVNAMLVIFNMIPAFPMDGGRVLRSLLAMGTSYRKATFLASRVGLLFAGLMAIVALTYGQPMPLLIAAFIGYAGMAEARQVEVMETVRGLSIADSMIENPPAIGMDATLPQIARRFQGTSATTLPVLTPDGIVVGMIKLDDIARASREGIDPRSTAGMLADHDVPAIRIHDRLESVLTEIGRQVRVFPVVDEHGRLAGILDLDSMLARGAMAGLFESEPTTAQTPRFDAFS